MNTESQNKKEDTDNIHQPHDKLVKSLLSNPKIAKDILHLYLPKEILAMVDLNQLSIQKDSFIDAEHRVYAVDLLYKTAFKEKEAYIWILIEHQRKSEYWLPLRIFHYIGIIWNHIHKLSKKKKLPLIYPLIIYNGATPYHHSLSFIDLLESEKEKEMFKTLFTQPFQIIDLSTIEDKVLREQMQKHIRGMTLIMALKHIGDPDINPFFEETLINMLKKLETLGDIDEVTKILYYLFREAKFLRKKKFVATIHQELSQETEEQFMTVAQEFREEGRQEGLQQGLQQGMEKNAEMVVRNLLKKGFDLFFIEEMTSLPIEKIMLLQKEMVGGDV